MTLPTPDRDGSEHARERRRYNSPIRRQRAAETRERIVAAGSALVHSFPTWDWRDLTFRALAERVGVSERTVYRHFPTERELHEAVMRRLEEEAGLSYEGLDLDNLAHVAARAFASLSSFAVAPGVTGDPEAPTFVADRRRRDALLGAVAPLTADWPEAQRRMVAALLDVIWTGHTYERMVTAWKLDADEATGAVAWVIELLVEAIRDGRRPGSDCSDR